MAKEFLGCGWKFPVELNSRGEVALSLHEEKIRQSIIIILGTAKGERVMRPDFGCGIHDFTFAVINASTLTMIESAVKEALILFEPRIEVTRIEVSTLKLDKGELRIGIDYKVRSTNHEFNIVFPFYLKPEG